MSVTPEEISAARPRRRRVTRPNLPAELRLTEKVKVRLTKNELAQLKAQAKAERRSRAAVLRATWLQLPPPANLLPEVLLPAGPARALTVAELAAYKQTLALANNLNQLVRLAHLQAEVREEALALFLDLRRQLADWVPAYVRRGKTKIAQNEAT